MTVRAVSNGKALGDPQRRLSISAASLAGIQLQPRPWLVNGLIPAKQVSSIDGDGGLGKSTLALQLCACVATGTRWLGIPVNTGRALYLSAEDDEGELHRRLASICSILEIRLEDLQELHLMPMAEFDAALVRSNGEDGIVETDRWRDLIGVVDQIRPSVLVLDSRADVFGGSEISRNQVRQFIGKLRALAISREIAVVLLAHPSLAGISAGTGASGSTHWRNAVRAALHLTRGESKGGSVHRKLTVKKANYAATGSSLELRWADGAFVLETQPETSPNLEAANAAIDQLFLRLLAEYTATGRHLSDKKGKNFAPTVFSRDPAARHVRSAGFAASLCRLKDSNRLRIEFVGPPSKQSRNIVAA